MRGAGYEAALSAPWAMLEASVEQLLDIASRDTDPSPAALEAYRANTLARAERATRRGDTAIVDAIGPMFRRANLMTAISGATSYDTMRADLQAAIDDPSITSILLNIDSPGGEVNGVDEMAKAIHAAREKKRIIAYVGGTGASAAYWLASAAGEIVVSDAALLGSIGVVMGMQDTSKRDESRGVRTVEFVSSQSPDKRLNIQSDEGRAKIQATVDTLGAVFVNAVASYRGIDANKVIADFGKGGVLVGAQAVAVGMADRLGTFEGVLEELASSRGSNRNSRSGGFMSNFTQADLDAAANSARVEGATAERARIQAIMGHENAGANADVATHLAYETDLPVTAAHGILAKAKGAPALVVDAELKAADPKVAADAYAAERSASAGLASPGNTPPKPSASAGWDDVVQNTNARRA